MNKDVAIWLLFRAARWLAWLAFFGFSIYYMIDPKPHHDSFGQLRHSAELVMFGAGLAAVFLGFLEMMMRERAGLARPSFGQLIPPQAAAHQSNEMLSKR